MRMLGLVVAGWLVGAGVAAAQPQILDCGRVEANGTRTLCHEVVLPTSREEAWTLLTSGPALSTWMAPVAALDLRVGGIWEASYDPNKRIGDPGNIRNRVLSFIPGRMISIAIDDAPPGFPHEELAQTLWTVMELESVDATHTRVRVTMLGYGQGEGYAALADMFQQGNAWTLQKLHERVTTGPVDWSAVRRNAATPAETQQ